MDQLEQPQLPFFVELLEVVEDSAPEATKKKNTTKKKDD
jgi:hypothetical protein